MALVGNYDASTFVEGDFDTYPPLPVYADYYQPSMHWRVTGAGTVHGQAVIIGDLLFATQGNGRLFGDGLFGDQIYGGLSDGDWTVEQVLFLRWDSTVPAPDTDPYPNAGCWFTRADQPGGDWAPGWRIVIDAYYPNVVGSRTFGTDSFGDDVYGDVDNDGASSWVDITQPGYRIETGDGTVEGGQRVPVAEVVVDFIDETGAWFDFAAPATWYQPQPGTPLRVGFIAPDFTYHPVIVGEIERIEDVHDGEHPRAVSVRAFGRIMDLTVDVPQVQRGAELASTRFNALAALAGWNWDTGSVVFPAGDSTLVADASPRDIVVRDEIDRTVQSCGWFFDADRRGRMRVREWPHVPTGEPIIVADCLNEGQWFFGESSLIEDPPDSGLYEVAVIDEDPDGSDLYVVTSAEVTEDPPGSGLFAVEGGYVAGTPENARLSPSIVFANDQSSLLNYVVTTNTDGASIAVDNPLSVAQANGRRGRALDYPKTGLAWSNGAAASAWAWRIVDRFGYVTKHVESFTVDTDLDPGWLTDLAELDTGRAVTVLRAGVSPLIFNAVVVGWRHVIEPGRWQSVLFTSTTTQSM